MKSLNNLLKEPQLDDLYKDIRTGAVWKIRSISVDGYILTSADSDYLNRFASKLFLSKLYEKL